MWESFKFDMICSHFLSVERWKVLLRYSPQPTKAKQSLRAHKDKEMLELKLGVSRFRATSRRRPTAAEQPLPPTPHPPTNTSVQTISLLSNERWDVALLHLWMNLLLCVPSTVLGREWRATIQSQAFLMLPCILVHQIAALGLAHKQLGL